MTLLLRLLALLASLSLAVRALDWSPHNNFRVAQLPVPATGKTGFTLLPAKYCADQKTMRKSLRRLLDHAFERILFAHGFPILSGGAGRLRTLLEQK